MLVLLLTEEGAATSLLLSLQLELLRLAAEGHSLLLRRHAVMHARQQHDIVCHVQDHALACHLSTHHVSAFGRRSLLRCNLREFLLLHGDALISDVSQALLDCLRQLREAALCAALTQLRMSVGRHAWLVALAAPTAPGRVLLRAQQLAVCRLRVRYGVDPTGRVVPPMHTIYCLHLARERVAIMLMFRSVTTLSPSMVLNL